MALREFKDYPDTTTPVDSENLNYNFKEIFNLVFPIGKVEIFFDNKDHSNFMGFTWERTSIGKVPVGIDTSDTDFNTIGKTGGEKKHTLKANELPTEAYKLYQRDSQATKQSQFIDALNNISIWTDTFRDLMNIYNFNGGQPHNNLQPYEVMAFWKRIS